MVLFIICLCLWFVDFGFAFVFALFYDVIRTKLTSQKSFNVYTPRNGMEREMLRSDSTRVFGAKFVVGWSSWHLVLLFFRCYPTSGLTEQVLGSLCRRRFSLNLLFCYITRVLARNRRTNRAPLHWGKIKSRKWDYLGLHCVYVMSKLSIRSVFITGLLYLFLTKDKPLILKIILRMSNGFTTYWFRTVFCSIFMKKLKQKDFPFLF